MKPSTLDGQTWLLSPNCSSLETGLYPNHANHQNGYLVSSVLSSSPSTLSPRSVSSCASLTSGSPSIITATVPVTKSETLKSISKPKFIRSSSLSASPSFGESNSFNHHAHHRQFSNNQDCIVTHSLPSFCWCSKKDCQTLTGGGCCELESTSSCNLNSGWKNNFNCTTTTRDIKNKTFCEKQQSANTTTATIATSIQSFSYVNVNHNNDVNSDSDQFFPRISPTLPSHDLISTGVDSTFISSDCPILPSGSTLCLLFCETTSNTKTRDNYYIKKQQNQENINNNRCHNINFVSAQENQCLPWHRSSCFFSSCSTLTAEEAATANESSSPCCDANFNHSNYKQANHDGDKDDCVDEDDDEDGDEKKKKGDGFDESSCKRRAESKKSCDVDSVHICSDNVDDNEYNFNRGIKVNSKSKFNNYLNNGRCLSYPGLNSCVSCDDSKNPNITRTCNDHLDDITSLINASSSRICKSWPTLAASLLNVNQLESHQQPSNSINNQCDIFSKDDLQHSWIELCKTLESISSELKHFQDKLEDSNYNLSDLSDLWSTLSSIDQFKHQKENNNNNYHNHTNLTKVNNYINNNNHINSFLDEVNWTFFESQENVTKLQSSVETINSVASCTSCSDEVMNFTINGQDRKRDTKFGKPPINHHSSTSSLVNKCKINLVRGEKANTKDESNVPRPVLHPVQIDCKHNKELSQQQLLTKSNQHNDQHHQQRDTVYVKPRRRDISKAKRDLKQLSESSNANNGLNTTDQAELERIRLLLSNLDSTKYRTRSGSRSRASSVSDSNRSSLNTNPPSTTPSTVSSQTYHKLKTVRQLSDLTNSDVNPAFPPIPLLTNVEVQSTPFGTIRKFRRSLSAAPLLITKESTKVSSPSLPPTAPLFPRRSGHPKLRELTNRNLFSKSCDVDSYNSNHNVSLNNTVTAHDNHNNHSNSNSVRSNRFGFNTKTVSGLVKKQKLTAGTVNDNYDEEKQKRKEINVDALVVAAAAQDDDDDDKCIVDGVKTTIRAKSVDRVVLLRENKRKDSRNKNSIGRGSLMMMASPSASSPTSRSSSPSTVNSATVSSSMESSQVDEHANDKCSSKLDSTLIRSLSISSSNTKQSDNQLKSKMDLRRSTSLIIMPNRLDPVVEEETTSNDGNNNVNDNTATQHGGIAKLQPPAKKDPSKENQCSTLPRRNCHQTSDSIKYNQLKDRLKPSWIKGKSDKIKDQQVKPITSIPPPPPPLPPSTVPASMQRQLDFNCDDGTTPSDSESLSTASETLPSLGSCLNLGEPSGSGSVVYRRAPKLSCTSPFRQNQSIDLGELRSHRLSHSSLDELPPPYSSSSSLTPKVDTEEREGLEADNLLEYNDNNNNNSNNSNVDEGANCQLKGKTGDNSCHVNDSRITILPEKRFRRKGHILMGDQHPMSVQNVITREQKGTQAITGQTFSPSRKSSLPEGRVSCSSESLLESEEIEDQRPQQIDYSEDDDGSALKDQKTEAQRSSSDQEQQGEQKSEQHRDRDYRPSVHRRTVSAVLPLGQIDDDNDSSDRELIKRNASGGGSDSIKGEGSSINYLSSNQSPIREKYRNIERHHSDTTGRLGSESVNIVDLIRSAKASVGSTDFKEDSSSKLDDNLMSTSATASTVGGSSSDINSRRLSSSTKRASSSTSQLNVSSSIGSLAGGSGSSGAGQYSNSSLDYSESSTLTYPGGLLMGSRGSPLGQTLGGSSVGPPSTPSTPSVSGSSSLTRPRYTKKPLRGPYGEMLEKEIRKSSMSEKQRSLYADLAFLNDLLEANKRRSKDSTSDFGGSNFKGSDSEISSERKSGLSNCSSLDDSTKRTSDIMVSEISDFETNPSPGRVSTPSIDVSDSPHHHISTQSAHSQNNLTTPQSQLKPKQQQHQPHTHQKPSRKQAISSSPSIATGDTSSVKYRDPLMSQLPEAEEESLINQISSEPESTGRWNKSNHKSSSDPFRRSIFAKRHTDTRTHVVGELYDTEKSYVESLQILVNKYMKPLKSAECSNLVDSTQVDHIFYQIPEILKHHEAFLESLKQRLTSWDSKQKVGDVFVEAFTKQPIIDTYTAFINNWKIAKDTIKTAIQAKQAFARYLENMSREHKGKLTLDAILIMPVQRIPRYELLIKELIKHTNVDHPDHQLLLRAQKEVHELALKINRMEREAFEQEQMAQKIKDIEHFIEGGVDLSSPDRTFIRYDFVTIPGALGTKKERCLFLFSDLLVITSIKKKSSATRKFSTSSSGTSPLSTLEGNKYKYLTRFPLESVDTAKGGDGNLRKTIKEIDSLREDAGILNQINELMNNLNCGHQAMEEAVRSLHSEVNRQLVEKQTNDSQLLSIELQVTSPEVVENLVIIFPSTEKRAAWEESFEAAKTKFAITNNQKPPPEFLCSIPIRKTRAGLQFTCASPTLYRNQYNLKDVWICNSDGFVGQVCVLTLHPTPTVASCNGVCNGQILCLASIPAATINNNCYPVSLRRSYVSEEPLFSETSGLEGTETEANTNCSILTSTCSTPSLSNLSSASIQSSPPASSNSFLVISARPESMGASTSPSRSLTPTPSTKSKQSTSVHNSPNPHTHHHHHHHHHHHLHQQPTGHSSSSQFQLDSESSDEESESSLIEETDLMRLTSETSHSPVDSCHSIDSEANQPTMWFGTRDGNIYIYNCNDNIRIRKNKLKIQLQAAVHCIIYMEKNVYSGLSNGQIVVFQPDSNGTWSTADYKLFTIDSGPIYKLLQVAGKLWCSAANQIKVIATSTMEVEKSFQVNSDPEKIVLNMVNSGLGVWISSQGSSIIKLYHGTSYECLLEVDVAPAVTKMLATCDEIIRQHKAACLRVTAMLACKDLLWIGTSAGIIMTLPLPHITPSTTSIDHCPNISGIPHGHTGHVRFLTTVDVPSSQLSSPSSASSPHNHHYDLFHSKSYSHSKRSSSQPNPNPSSKASKILVISGGDGYEDFSNFGHNDSVGRDDSTNHLLLWHV